MGRNCLFVRKGEKEKKKGLIKKFLSPCFSAPLFHCPPIVSKVVTRTICSLRCSRRRPRPQRDKVFRPTDGFELCLPREAEFKQPVKNCSFAVLLLSFLRHEGVWPGIIAHSASKSLAAHSPVCRRSLQKTDQNKREEREGREIDRRSAPPTPRRDKFLFFHPEREGRKGERKR